VANITVKCDKSKTSVEKSAESKNNPKASTGEFLGSAVD